MKIVIIDYGAGNVFSVRKAIERLGFRVCISDQVAELQDADRVIFPGVGQASAAMVQLKRKKLDEVLPRLTMPVLGICLGMQLMCCHTEEENTPGLGIFPIKVKKFTGECKVPHMGWNQVDCLRTRLFDGIKEPAWMYFVHSYYVPCSEFDIAVCDYGGTFAAAIHKDNFYGCQFHPEKSSVVGEQLIMNFLNL